MMRRIDRPTMDGRFANFRADLRLKFDAWPYGLQRGVPSYASPLPASVVIRNRYLQRDIVYLLGTADDDPRADGLDFSCGAEDQGPTRLARGLSYDAYVHKLDRKTARHVLSVDGVAHHVGPMYLSACGDPLWVRKIRDGDRAGLQPFQAEALQTLR